MAYNFSNLNQIAGSQKLYSIFKKDFPLLLSGYYTNSEFIPAVDEELSADTQYYFLNTSYCNYPDSPKYNNGDPKFSGSLCRTGILLDDEDIRPFIVISEKPTQSKDFYLRYLQICLGKKCNYIVKNSKSYNYMKSVIDKGVTSYYYRNCYLRQPYNDKHEIDGDYEISVTSYDSTNSKGYWNSSWKHAPNSDVEYFDLTDFDFCLDGDTHGWHFETNIPIFTSWEDAFTWVLTGQKNNEFILKKSTAVNFGLWIDGLKKPIYKLNWHIPALEEENFDFDGAIVEVKAGVSDSSGIYHKLLTSIPYNDGSVGFTWSDFENLGLKTSLLSPYVELTARVVLSNDTKTDFPSVKLKEKALNFEDIYSDITTADDGSTFEVFQGSGENSDDYEPPEDSDDGNDENGDGTFSTSSALTTTYGMTLSRLRGLGQFLWDTSFIENIKLVNNSPIENIISVKAFPFNIDGSDENIKLGNVDTGISGEKTSSNVVTLYKGSVNIDKKYNSFLDFAPYTKVALHLPYIGFVELDTNIIMGKTISIRYIVDLIEGGCMAQVIVNARVINEYKGVMGIDIPITASNRAQVEASHVAGAINAIGNGVIAGISAASGNFVGTAYGIQNSVNSLLDSAMTPYHYSTQGGGTPAVSSGDKANRNIYVIIDRPMYQELSSFNHTRGRLCNLTQRIGHLKGFTSTTPMIDLNGIPCTGAEKEEIRQILSSGFFV